ncbi:MAG: Gfo/Idh/MocA family oxidoreductase [Clostridia bacterium]|nr:Gfo/Idh/MocA family oxidoreductase [Clostridia bacterium]
MQSTPSIKQYNIALIGCGNMGAAHLDNIYTKDNVTIHCVCDIDPERAKAFAHKYHAKEYETDYKKAIAMPEVDIVIIATYPSSHLDIVKECISNGKHILCEKPIAQDLQTGQEIVKLIQNHPECKVLVGYILRHNKTYQHVARMIQEGAIGKPIVMRMAQNHHTMDWGKYLNLINETSPIVDCGVHYLDVMRWFTGAEITDISGIGLKTEADVPQGKYNYGLITVRLSDGSIAYYEAGWGNTISSDNLKEFVGPKGRIRITYQMSRQFNQEEGDLVEYYTYPEGKYETININCKRKPTDDQLQELIDMIEQDKKSSPTLEDVMKSFEWVLKADENIKSKL